jgi:hypothetical protein
MTTAMDFYKQEGVKDLKPMKARGLFARALMIEEEAGKTTPEAEEQLNLAIEAENGPSA